MSRRSPSKQRSARKPAANVRTSGPLLKQSNHPCFACNRCCTYVSTEIDAPTSMTDYDHICWYLYHAGISVYMDWEGAWYLLMESRCENLTPHGLCSVYDHRPAICKDFDWRDCEKQVSDNAKPPEKFVFHATDEFLGWLKKRRPKGHARYLAFLARKHGQSNDPELARLGPS